MNDASENLPTAPSAPLFASDALFRWYDRNGRTLPWRRRWPELAPAYHVWLSEIMLQQTVVATVIPYFLDFTRRWPNVQALADAPLDDVLGAWAGLGYYARARNLHKAAQFVVNKYAGQFPQTYDELLTLPGVGPYTAGAISVIAFGRKNVVVDGNIERVMSRHFAITTPLPAAKKDIGAVYHAVMPDKRPSDFPQALMDFATAVCTVKNPGCEMCPLAENCIGLAQNIAETLPVKAPKRAKEERRGIAFVAMDGEGNALLVRREGRGMLGGMLGFPSFGWASRNEAYDRVIAPFANAPFDGFDSSEWRLLPEPVDHVFTHFALTIDIAVMQMPPGHNQAAIAVAGGQWQKIKPAELPSLMRKIWKQASKVTKIKAD